MRRWLTALLLAGACLAQDAGVDLGARMDQIARTYADGKQFMGTVLVARGDQVLLSKGYGFANLEWGIANTPSTKFRLGSITKQFTAAAILLLEERGLLKIEDPVKKYLPDAPAHWDKVTVFHLLTHTSGITNNPSGLQATGFPTTAANVDHFRNNPLDFEPGARWNYSNNGYILLGYLIEKLSNRTYEGFLRDNIFTPLGMKDSGYDSAAEVIERRADGYSSGITSPMNAAYIAMNVAHGAGALYSTTEDLLRWERALFGGKLLSPATLQKMITPFQNNYALGVGVQTVNGRKTVSHSGAINGFNTMMAHYPESQVTVIALGNLTGSAPSQIAARLGAIAHGETVTLQSERVEIPLGPEVLARYLGTYRMAGGADMVIALAGSQLTSKLGGQSAIPLFAESETRFFTKTIDAQIEFSAGALTLRQGGRDTQGTRLDDAVVKRMAEAAADIERRIKNQTQSPGTEAALRAWIEGIGSGQPDYSRMSAGLTDGVRRQLPQLQASLKERGALQTIAFKGVGPGGTDIYEVRFAEGLWEYRITLDGGKIAGGQLTGVQVGGK